MTKPTPDSAIITQLSMLNDGGAALLAYLAAFGPEGGTTHNYMPSCGVTTVYSGCTIIEGGKNTKKTNNNTKAAEASKPATPAPPAPPAPPASPAPQELNALDADDDDDDDDAVVPPPAPPSPPAPPPVSAPPAPVAPPPAADIFTIPGSITP